jgi:uncharacterized protein (DUF983 family)
MSAVAEGQRDGTEPAGLERWRTFGRLWGAMLGRCPACGAPGAFAGPYRLRPACARCGVVFERDAGSFLGATVLAYSAAVLAMVVVALATIPGRGLYPGLEAWLIGSATLTVLLLYRPIKGGWLWVTWAAGWVHRDREDPERRSA